MQLSSSADNTERRRIIATERIGERVIFRVCRSDRLADVCVGSRVLCDGARRAVTVSKGGCLIDIRDTDSEKDRIEATLAIGCADGEIVVNILGFKIQGCLSLQLPCIGVNPKRCRIASMQRVGQGIPTIGVCRLERIPDSFSRSRILRYGACGSLSGETRCLIDIRDTDCHINAITPAIDIGDRNRHRVGIVCFIVQGCTGLQLSRCADDTERRRIIATECISERVPCIRIRRSNSCADILSRCRVLRNNARRAIAIAEHGGAILTDIHDADCHINRRTPTIVIGSRNRH